MELKDTKLEKFTDEDNQQKYKIIETYEEEVITEVSIAELEASKAAYQELIDNIDTRIAALQKL